jgi:hypothetical protein
MTREQTIGRSTSLDLLANGMGSEDDTKGERDGTRVIDTLSVSQIRYAAVPLPPVWSRIFRTEGNQSLDHMAEAPPTAQRVSGALTA